jgi:hypothetical protein
MQAKAPRDLPDLRLWLMDQWRPGAMFSRMAELQRVQVLGGEPVVNMQANTQRDALPKAELWWVTEDMTRLVDHSSKTLPETTLTKDLLPAYWGLVAYALPLVGTQSDTGEPINTHVMVWSASVHRRSGKRGISITSYEFIREGQQMGNSVQGYSTAPKTFWTPTGMTTWLLGSNTEANDLRAIAEDETRSASLAEDRRWLAATWLLASQPLTRSTIHHADRNVAKRSRRKDVASDVREVDLRPRTKAEPAGGGGGPRKEHDHRWMVAGPNGDGFWRQQPCGPGQSERRPMWIYPYEAGPKDKPLKIRETVRVLRGDPPATVPSE